MYKFRLTRQAEKDYAVARKNGFAKKLTDIFDVLERDPYEVTPGHHYEELRDNMKGFHSRRLNRANRVTYEVLSNSDGERDKYGNLYEGIIRVLTMWGHPY